MGGFWGGYLLGVSQNFVASLVLGIPAFLHLHRKLDRHHREESAAASLDRLIQTLRTDDSRET
jgi:hypothetical protein